MRSVNLLWSARLAAVLCVAQGVVERVIDKYVGEVCILDTEDVVSNATT